MKFILKKKGGKIHTRNEFFLSKYLIDTIFESQNVKLAGILSIDQHFIVNMFKCSLSSILSSEIQVYKLLNF